MLISNIVKAVQYRIHSIPQYELYEKKKEKKKKKKRKKCNGDNMWKIYDKLLNLCLSYILKHATTSKMKRLDINVIRKEKIKLSFTYMLRKDKIFC